MKPVVFHPKARETIRDFPEEVRRELGKAIYDLQKGHLLSFPLSRHMSSVARGVEELRVKDRTGAYRVFYYARLTDRVLIFHAFVKKAQETPRREIELSQRRLKELLHETL